MKWIWLSVLCIPTFPGGPCYFFASPVLIFGEPFRLFFFLFNFFVLFLVFAVLLCSRNRQTCLLFFTPRQCRPLNTNVEERKWKVDGFPPSAHTFLLFFLSSKEFLLIDVVLLLSNESPSALFNQRVQQQSLLCRCLCVMLPYTQTERASIKRVVRKTHRHTRSRVCVNSAGLTERCSCVNLTRLLLRLLSNRGSKMRQAHPPPR
jgi:hypothetical protein